MNQQARQLGEYIRSTRKAQCMSIRMLAAQAGIGNFILIQERYFRPDRIIAAILTIGVLGLITDSLFALYHRWAFPYVERVHA